MKNFYHFVLAMVYLKISRRKKSTEDWTTWLAKSINEIGKIKPE